MSLGKWKAHRYRYMLCHRKRSNHITCYTNQTHNSMRGEVYIMENIRKEERAKAVPVLNTMKRTESEWKELVRQGLAKVVKEILPCRGVRLHYQMI